MSTSVKKILTLLEEDKNPQPESTTIFYEDGKTTVITEYPGAPKNAIRIEDKYYSLDDPTVAERIKPEFREQFWSCCSDKAKDSDLYRSYAVEQITKHNIQLNNTSNTEVKRLLVNHVTVLVDWAKFFGVEQSDECIKLIIAQDEILIRQFLTKPSSIKILWQGLRELGYEQPLQFLITLNQTKPESFKTIFNNPAVTMQALTSLKNKFKYTKPLVILSEISRLQFEDLLLNYTEIFDAISILSKLEYSEPVKLFFSLESDGILLLRKNYKSSLVVMQGLIELGNKHPLDTFLHMDSVKRKILLENTQNLSGLIKFFSAQHYINPSEVLLNLSESTLELFLKNVEGVVSVMNKLSLQGINNPPEYLNKLGALAIQKILRNREVYLSKIEKGANLEKEFTSNPWNDQMTYPLRAFIGNIGKKNSNTTRLAALGLVINKDNIRDTKTMKIPDVPVRLDGDLFDLDTLTSLKADHKGYRNHPSSQRPFLLNEIQPAKDIQLKIEKHIVSAMSQIDKVVVPTPLGIK